MPISIYNPTQKAGVSIGQPSLQSASIDVAGSWRRNNPLEGVTALTKGVIDFGKHVIDTKRIADVTEQSMLFMKDLSAYKSDYMRNNQGKNAVEAGAAFESFAQERLAKMEEESGLDMQGRTMLARTTGPTAIGFISQGHSYGIQQENTWKDSTAKGAIASLSQFTAENYMSPELVDAQRDITKTQLAGMYPGMDMTAQFAAIDQQTTSDRIGAFMAGGDLASAKALFTRDRGLLGSRADEMAMKIANREEHNLRMSLAYDEKNYREQQRANALISNNTQKDITDSLLKNDFSTAQSKLDSAREVLDANDYNRLAYAIKRPPVASSNNIQAMGPLLDLQRSADPSQRAMLPGEAQAAFLRGDITQSTYEDFAKTQIGDGDVHALNNIKTSFEGWKSVDPTSGLAQSNAEMDYTQWTRANPDATYEQRQRKGKELIHSYSLLRLDEFVLGFQYNPYVTRSAYLEQRSKGLDGAYLDAAEDKLADDVDAGRIPSSEAGKLSVQIQNLRAAAAREAQAKAKLQPQGNVK